MQLLLPGESALSSVNSGQHKSGGDAIKLALKSPTYLGLAAFVILVSLAARVAGAQSVQTTDPAIKVRAVTSVPASVVRLVADPLTNDLFYLRTGGDIYRVDVTTGSSSQAFQSSDHGLASGPVHGMAAGPDGALYVVGNVVSGPNLSLRVVRGTPGTPYTWTTIAESEAYPLSGTAFDHLFNGIVVDEAGEYLYINAGSRTDHGEIQNRSGSIADLREVPISSAILRIPLGEAGVVQLYNNEDSLAAGGYLFADGVRNSFDLAFDGRGYIFATENSGDRDDEDEINWIREGAHFGFPWRMGGNDTPMQFAGYDPASDLLLNPTATAAQGGFFYDDPAYPSPPPGVTFADPIANVGPDANVLRDAATGATFDADATGEQVYSLTPHRSPLGLVFDTAAVLDGRYNGNGFVLSWTDGGSNLLGPFNDPGEDLLLLQPFYPSSGNAGPDSMRVEQIATGFSHPIDAVLRDTSLYVVDMVFGGTGTLWELRFPRKADPTNRDRDNLQDRSTLHTAQLYPNPSSREITIELVSESPLPVEVTVFDALGRQVVSRLSWNPEFGTARRTLDLGAKATGIVFVQLSRGAEMHTFPILVRR